MKKRHALDRPGKLHIVILKDDDGKILGHTWMTTEQQGAQFDAEMNRLGNIFRERNPDCRRFHK